MYGDDDPRLRAQVVHHHECAREDEDRVGRGNRTRRRRRQPLDVAHDVVCEVPDGAAPERPELGRRHRIVRGHLGLQVGDGVGGRARAMPALGRRPVLDHAVDEAPRGARLGAEVGVARPRLAAGRRALEQERERAAPELGEGAHRRVGVEETVAPDGHEAAGASQRAEAIEGEHRGRVDGERGGADAVCNVRGTGAPRRLLPPGRAALLHGP